jgi:iron complex transport system permease protein
MSLIGQAELSDIRAGGQSGMTPGFKHRERGLERGPMTLRGRSGLLFGGLAAITAASVIAALASGSADVGFAAAWQALGGSAPDNIEHLVWQLRMPRALTAFGVGGLLAVAGVLMQVLLRNPLAEPYILGSSGGAAVAALLAMMLGFGSALIDIAAFGGAMAATVLVFSIAQGSGSWAPARLLLTGVVLAAGFSAATTLLLALSPDQNLRGMLFWLMGDLSFAYSPGRSLWLLAVIALAGTLASRHLNVLARGELQAAIVGLPVAGFRLAIFAVTSLAVAVSVTTVGVIGFIGLVVPHLVRLMAGSDHRVVLPASALAGGSLLVIADTLARTVMAPRQLPVGALTAAIGVPLFLILMSRSRRSG